jgi:hypothetical protein
MITRAQIRRQLRAQGGITNTVPREGFFLGGIKKRLRKLIPNELADFAVKAAPFVAPFQPGIAAAMRGLGRFDQRGSVSDALKQGLGTYALGRGARFLAGAEGASGGPGTFSMDRFREGPVGRLFKGTETNIGDAKKNVNLKKISTDSKGLKSIRDATSIFKDVPILKELPSIVQQQILVGGASAAGTYLYNAFLAEEPPQEEGETMEEYMARRKENVGNKMRTYFDNYFRFDKEYSSMTDEQKNAFVARYNIATGGRVGYQTGGISMANTLQQNLAANRAQASGVQAMLQAARSKLPGATPQVTATPQAAPAGITTVPTPQASRVAAPQPMAAPVSTPQTRTPPPGIMAAGPGLGGYTPEQFDKLSQTQQDKIMDQERIKMDEQAFQMTPYYQQTIREAPTQLRILQERGVATPTLYDKQGNLNNRALVLAKLTTDLKEAGVQLTGNETPDELLQLEEEEKQKIMKEISEAPMFDPYTAQERAQYTGPTEFTYGGGQTGAASPMYNQGGRVGYDKGGMMSIPTGDMRRNKAGVIERDYRDKGGFVPVGVKEKADDVPAMLSKNEFVMTADAVRAAGGGSINKGAQRMYDTMKKLEGRVR